MERVGTQGRKFQFHGYSGNHRGLAILAGHFRLIHSSQVSLATVYQCWIWASDFENGDCSRPEMSVYIVNCYRSYNKNLLRVTKHSSLSVYYFSLLFVGRHGSLDVSYHHAWHFMQ